ncbi:MAG: ABC transporter permease [Deltaproteobacteria bacterium RBG_13_43_22]|nr:MAG: ABC transporter permease [Deltaproteobacteria bacterium RBG_13_43_22]
MTSLDRKLLRDLIHYRGQAIAVALVVLCGLSAFVTMHNTFQSLVVSQSAYYSEYRFAEVFAQLKRAPESLTSSIAAIPGVTALQTRIVFEVILDVPGLKEPATGRLVSIPGSGKPLLNDLALRQGRTIEPGRRNEVIISEAFAQANQLKPGNTLGAIINGRWEHLLIVGVALSPEYVIEIPSGTILPDSKRFGVLWMSREAMGPAFQMKGAFNDLSLTLAPGTQEAEVIARLDRVLEPYGGLGAYGRSDQLSNRFLSDEIAQNRVSGMIVPSIFLGVAVFLIHIVLSRLIILQRNQIALLKAFGYSSSAIGFHYLKFALVVIFAGSLPGTVLGLWLGSLIAEIYQQFYRFPVFYSRIRPDLLVLVIFISFAAAGLGALLSVRKAVSLPPAEAMRPEPPARFRPGLIERIGLQRFISPALRMIIRNLGRNRAKAGFTLLGIAFAVAILLVGRYSFDSVEYLIRVQFETIQREDAMLIFNHPVGSGARYDTTRLPGVRSVESFRLVPARLRFEHRSRRIGIQGISPTGRLRQLLDKDLRPVNLPSEGLVLTKQLADSLQVRPGYLLSVEVLEGKRPVLTIPVAGIIDELLGISAYMDLRSLNKHMHEGPAVSGAFLTVDPLQEPDFFTKIKKVPAVAGVAFRKHMVQGFRDTIAQSMYISTFVLIIFASVIAFGLVYNSARISLSERGHEMASLRVLGFTEQEIARILLGEQAFLTLTALPVGLIIGYYFCWLMSKALETELYRFPLVLTGKSVIYSLGVTVLAAFISGLFVRRRLKHLDLIAVLKTRE